MSNFIQFRAFAPSRLRAFAPSRLRAFAPSRLRAFAPSRLRAFAPSRLRAFAPSRLRAFAPSRLRALSYSFAQKIFSSFAKVASSCFTPLARFTNATSARVGAYAPVSHNSTPTYFQDSAPSGQSVFCARAKFQSFRHKAFQNSLCFRGLFAVLAAAFLLAACAPVGSSPSGPPKKTEAQALQALETETENLEKAINTEIDTRKAYVAAAVSTGQTPEIAMLHLLRRIVVLGQTPQKSLADLLQEWRAAKKAVEEVQKKIETLIKALENDYGEAAKQEATKVRANVTDVTNAVKEVRQATTTAAITTAETKVKTAVQTAKETVTNAKENAQAADLLRPGDLLYSVLEGTGGAHYKLAAGAPAKLGAREVALFNKFNGFRYIGGLTDYVVIRDRRNKAANIYVRRKSGGTPTLVQTHKNLGSGSFSWIYAGGYVYYSVPFQVSGQHSPALWRFNPANPTSTSEELTKQSSTSFAVDKKGNILAIGVVNAKFRKANGTVINVNIPGNSRYDGFWAVALNGKIYLLELKNNTVKAFAVNQNGNVNAQEIDSVTQISGDNFKVYHVGASTVFAKVSKPTNTFSETQHVLRFDGSSLSKFDLPKEKGKSKKVFQNSDGETFSFKQGQQAFYALLGSSTDAKKGTNVYRAGATKFEPVLPEKEANKLANIYQFDVLPGSPDRIAIAAKTKTGKYVAIELDANSKKVLRRSPELDNKIGGVFFWR